MPLFKKKKWWKPRVTTKDESYTFQKFNQLPEEIIAEIIDFYMDKHTLLDLSVTSKRMCLLAQQRLFNSIQIFFPLANDAYWIWRDQRHFSIEYLYTEPDKFNLDLYDFFIKKSSLKDSYCSTTQLLNIRKGIYLLKNSSIEKLFKVINDDNSNVRFFAKSFWLDDISISWDDLNCSSFDRIVRQQRPELFVEKQSIFHRTVVESSYPVGNVESYLIQQVTDRIKSIQRMLYLEYDESYSNGDGIIYSRLENCYDYNIAAIAASLIIENLLKLKEIGQLSIETESVFVCFLYSSAWKYCVPHNPSFDINRGIPPIINHIAKIKNLRFNFAPFRISVMEDQSVSIRHDEYLTSSDLIRFSRCVQLCNLYYHVQQLYRDKNENWDIKIPPIKFHIDTSFTDRRQRFPKFYDIRLDHPLMSPLVEYRDIIPAMQCANRVLEVPNHFTNFVNLYLKNDSNFFEITYGGTVLSKEKVLEIFTKLADREARYKSNMFSLFLSLHYKAAPHCGFYYDPLVLIS